MNNYQLVIGYNVLNYIKKLKIPVFPPIALPTSIYMSRYLAPYPMSGEILKEQFMSKSSSSGRPSSSHPGPGGNWPSTTGRPSGGGRGNGPTKGK